MVSESSHTHINGSLKSAGNFIRKSAKNVNTSGFRKPVNMGVSFQEHFNTALWLSESFTPTRIKLQNTSSFVENLRISKSFHRSSF
jgi:hypothetical protein